MENLLFVCILVAAMFGGRTLYVLIYQKIYGRHPDDVYQERLLADPVFGKAYQESLNPDGSMSTTSLYIRRAYDGRDGLG